MYNAVLVCDGCGGLNGVYSYMIYWDIVHEYKDFCPLCFEKFSLIEKVGSTGVEKYIVRYKKTQCI
jgi:hypothetical protein